MENVLAEKFGKENRWVNWKLEKSKDGKLTKVPYYMKAKRASVSNPKTWKTYEQSVLGFDNGSNNYSGIGIMLHDSKLICVDIDHVLVDGKIVSPFADVIMELLKTANTFTEISQSGTGLHLFFYVPETFTPVANKKAPFEVYSKDRFIALTNNSFDAIPLNIRTVTALEMESILEIIGYPFGKDKEPSTTFNSTIPVFEDSELLNKMFASKNGDKIKSLYNGDISSYNNDDSSADSALCFHLAFWTGKNTEQMKRMWLASPLGQRKKTQGRKDYVNRTIANAISNCVEIYTPKVKDGESLDPKSEKSDKKETSTQADLLLKLFLDRDDVILFKDERELPYISLLINSHRENWRCGTKNVKDLLSYEFYKKYKKSIGSEVVKNVISIFDGSAKFDGDKKTLFNRVALVDGVIWYDLTNSDWQAVKITNKGWEIVNEPPILFKRFSHQHAQVLPVAGGSIYTLFNYINISRDDHKILLIVLLISYFVPNFPHPAIVLFGSAGAAKTTVAKILRRINDPTLLEAMTLPKDQKELIQKLDHHYFPFFDNISHLSEETSDLLCKAITGSGFSKRVLYTDDDDIIYNFKRCIGLNGISVVATKPDLLERSILIELEKVDDSVRKGEEGIHEKINRDIPLILGGIFDVLVKAIEIKPTIKLEKLPRMADFMLWGCAIAEAAGIEKQLFIDAYNNNLKDQVKVAINDNPVALAVVLLMNSRVEWRGTATELLSKLNSEDEFADRYGSGFPKAPNMLVKRLNELKTSLKAIGILYESENDGAVKTIILTKVDVDMNSGSSTKPDDTDDVF